MFPHEVPQVVSHSKTGQWKAVAFSHLAVHEVLAVRFPMLLRHTMVSLPVPAV